MDIPGAGSRAPPPWLAPLACPSPNSGGGTFYCRGRLALAPSPGLKPRAMLGLERRPSPRIGGGWASGASPGGGARNAGFSDRRPKTEDLPVLRHPDLRTHVEQGAGGALRKVAGADVL